MNRLDLRNDLADVLAYIAGRVRSFEPKTNHGPGDGTSVARIDVVYQCDQAGWVALIFDTRPRAQPDGQCTLHVGEESNRFDRPDWRAAFEALEVGPLVVVLPDGEERKLRKEAFETLTEILGELLKDLLLRARDEGLFGSLPKAPRCELGVEEHDGAYGWPAYEDRGRENLA